MQEEEAFATAALIIFFAEFFYWFLTVFLINKVTDSETLKTAIYAAALTFSDYLAIFFYVKNVNYLLPACLGAFVGAALAVEYDKRRQKNLKAGESQS